MAELPVRLGDLAAVPPALAYRLRDALAQVPVSGELEGVARDRLARVIEDGEAWLPVEPALAEVGYWMIDARHGVELRQRGCQWLTMFPGVETARRLGALVLDPSTPAPVREQATWTLGDRQLRAMHPAVQWSAEAIQLADEVLGKLADAATVAGTLTNAQLAPALRHVQSELTAAVFAKAPGLWGEALEAFASAPLARVLFVSIGDIPAQHRLRVLRLAAAVLGEEAVPLLVSRSADAPIDEQLEMLYLALTFGGERHLPRLEDTLRGLAFADQLRARARWHLAHPGVVPTVRGLRVARQAAVLPPAVRVDRCAQAADDLGALTAFARHGEAYLYTLWGWMVRAAGDPVRARALVSAHPASQQLVPELYLEDLARRGRVEQVLIAAHELRRVELGALHLAIHGRPLAALELAATARHHTPELVCARALACHRAGRPDLAARLVTEDVPAPEVTSDEPLASFPGAHELWMLTHAPASRPALPAIAEGLGGVLSLARPAPLDAAPDVTSLDGIAAVVRRLARGLAGATVFLAGTFETLDKAAIGRALEAAGARLVTGPAPGTDFYVHGDRCPGALVAQLERQGSRRIRRGEVEGVT